MEKLNFENPEKPKYWRDLSEKEKKLFPEEEYIISVVTGMPLKEIDSLYNNLRIKNGFCSAYITGEIDWMKKWYQDEKNIENKILEEPIHEQFRLYFTAKNPNEVKAKFLKGRMLKNFLLEIDKAFLYDNKLSLQNSNI